MAHHCRWCNRTSTTTQGIHLHEQRGHGYEYWETVARHHEVEAALAHSKAKGARQRLQQEAA